MTRAPRARALAVQQGRRIAGTVEHNWAPGYALALLGVVLLGVAVGLGGMQAAAVPLGAAAAIVAVWRPLSLMLVLLAYIPVEGFLLKWAPPESAGAVSLAPEALTLLCGLAAVTRFATGSQRKAAVRWLLFVAAFTLAGLLSAHLNRVDWFQALYWVRTVVRYMPAAVVVAILVDKRVWLRQVAPLIAATVVLQALVVLVEIVIGDPARAFFAPGDRVVGGVSFVDYTGHALTGNAGTLGLYNNFGLFAALGFAVCIGSAHAWRHERSRRRGDRWRILLTNAGSAAAVVAVVASASRQSVVAFAITVLLGVVLLGVRGFGGRTVPIALGAVGVMMAAMVWPEIAGPLQWVPQRFTEALSGSFITQSLASDRLFALVTVAPAVMDQAPVFGLGPGSLSAMTEGTIAETLGLQAGSVAFVQDVGWVGLITQTGLVGLALVVYAFGWLALRARRGYVLGVLDHGLYFVVVAGVAIVAVGMMASSPLLIRSVSFVLWIVAGLALRVPRRRRPAGAGRTEVHIEARSGAAAAVAAGSEVEAEAKAGVSPGVAAETEIEDGVGAMW